MDYVYLYTQENLFEMGKIENELINMLNQESKKHRSDPVVKRFIKADKEFNELVKMGLASRRGNNLLPKEDIHLRRYTFNSK